jgi:hypothetical protein
MADIMLIAAFNARRFFIIFARGHAASYHLLPTLSAAPFDTPRADSTVSPPH